jgi:hypothetical protein
MSSIRLKPDELDLLARLIDRRDSAHLAGITTDPFSAIELNGGVSVLACPGRTGREQAATLTIHRLRSAGLFQVISENKSTLTFDLVDDVRDQLELLREAAGQPSLVGQERAARASAEDQLSGLQVKVEADAGEREARRQATSKRVGRWAFRVALIGLVAVYLLATAIMALATTVVIAGIVAAGLLGLIGVLSWGFHLDAFAAAHWVETRVAGRFKGWLDAFEMDEHG